MVASIDGGEMLHFNNVGLYDGLFVMQDEESKTLWNHITGEALYGPYVGRDLGPVGNLMQMSVDEALEFDASMRVAISDRPYAGDGSGARGRDRLSDDARLSQMFIDTLGREDARLPRMTLGLGIWTDQTRRYYPMDEIRARGPLIDAVDGRNVLVYIEPRSATPTAVYVDANSVTVDGNEIHLDNGAVIRAGVLFDPAGDRLESERPQQYFTRWYGYSLTFPGADVFGQ